MATINDENSQGKLHQRKLAAIMFTDMVAYSALSQSNEELALDLLNEHQRILRPIFPKHDGREIETAGDSFFVEFNSAVEAANCAIEIQTTLYERNKSVEPERNIRLRIGLHIGDVVQIENHVHGDGVNIASRLEPLATPEGICLSEDFARAVQNKLAYPVVKKGEATLKNISSPMGIYCVQLPWVKEKAFEEKKTKTFYSLKKILIPVAAVTLLFVLYMLSPLSDDKEIHTRIAVLPFTNIGGDSEDEYFAEGMTEQIISSLSNLSGMNVIARSSVLKYKGGTRDIKDIGTELNVGTILEGSFSKFKDKARINVQLIDVSKQENIWAMNYDKDLRDIFMIQSEIAQSIANELEVKLNTTEESRLGKKNPVDTDAFTAYLQGRFHLNRRTIDGVATSIKYFEKAIMHDTAFALAYSGLADAYTLIGAAGYGFMSVDDATTNAKLNVMKALELDNGLAEAHASLAYIKFRLEWKFDEAETEFKKAIELGPGYAQAHEWYALYLSLRGRFNEALERMLRAQELNPLSTSISNGLGRIYYFMMDMKKAISQFNKTIQMDPNYAEVHASLGMTYGLMKEYDKSIQAMEKAVELSNRRLVILSRLAYYYAMAGRKDDALKIKQELDQRSNLEDVSPFYYFAIYAGLGDNDKAFELIEKAYKEKFGLILYLKADKSFYILNKDPRYSDLIKRIGL
jgi:TolB-like protein/class 3 adenylate cyclase/Tfp pilus assembly protein PilF